MVKVRPELRCIVDDKAYDKSVIETETDMLKRYISLIKNKKCVVIVRGDYVVMSRREYNRMKGMVIYDNARKKN